ncbi:porin [Palleronia caenipelagi]|uniref:Porin n=1 Tax=Palleronia caenipelagi TaxID=2489174 RepID=A0A547PKV2_9RHOB|nr:porin [Palleronia caenipelagi]TRD14733.1 porin [Palleronia caenipelagi]
MSKTLLISTAIVAASALHATAEVELRPSASFGIKSTDAGHSWNADAVLGINVSASTTADDGTEVEAAFTIETGNLADSDGNGTTGSVVDPNIHIRGDWGEVYVIENGDDEAVFGFTTGLNSTSFKLEHNWDTDVSTLGLYQNFDQFRVGLEANTDEEYSVKLSYDNSIVNASAKVDQNSVFTVTGGVMQDNFSFGAEYNTLDEWSLNASYNSGLHSIKLVYEHDEDYLIEARYGLNDKLSLYADAKVEDQKDAEIALGVKLSF